MPTDVLTLQRHIVHLDMATKKKKKTADFKLLSHKNYFITVSNCKRSFVDVAGIIS